MPARGLRRASGSPLAARVGLTRARPTQLMHLLLLAPAVQERIAMRDLVLSERALRRVVTERDWDGQLDGVEAITGET